MKIDIFRNVSDNFLDSLFEICHNYTEGMKSYQKLKLQTDSTVKILFQKNLFETFLF